MDTFPLKDARHSSFPNEPITDWDYVTDDEMNGQWRVYFKPVRFDDDCCKDNMPCRHGFYFYSTAWGGNYGDDPMWSPETFADTLYYGTALFDGIRHVNMGSDEDGIFGYTNYPDPNVHIQIWQTLLLLEGRYCSNVQR